jgi:hypothetical protein
MPNPLVNQGVLNKLRGSVSVIDLPQLNATAPYLGEDGITLAFEGDASGYIGTMTGAVPSPNPYQMATVTLHLLKTQDLGNQWKLQQESDTTIGDVVVTTDAATLESYYLSNCTIKGVSELSLAGKDPGYVVTVQGTYYINSGLFNLP